MPIYEYTCALCGHELETIQKMSDAPLVDCPECGKPGLKKRISAAGFRLKGTGWYETDFKGGSAKKEDKDKKQTTGSEGKKEEGAKEKSDKKPAAKSDAASAKTGTGD